MARESFIFYRSFHEAIKCMSDVVRAQIYVALADYALDGIEPENLSSEAKGMFMLMKPIIDTNNARYANGKKGAKYGKLGGRPRKKPKEAEEIAPEPPYCLSFSEETEKMKDEEIFIDGVCKNFNIDKNEIADRLDRFALHCDTECSDKPHSSIADAKRHFTSWMRKAYPASYLPDEPADIPPPDYSFNGGFGGLD